MSIDMESRIRKGQRARQFVLNHKNNVCLLYTSNWFNEFYARDTSRKIRAVQKAKGERGVPLTVNVPYGYVKDLSLIHI